MVSCVVTNCKNASGKLSKNRDGITFHRFPHDNARKEQWEIAVNREQGWCSTPSSTVCSEHFNANDFYLTKSGLRKLSLNAVPCINISPCQDLEPTICNMQPANIKPSDSEEVVKLKFKVQRLEAISEMRKKRLSLMSQDKRRLKKKLMQMKWSIRHLIKNENINEHIKTHKALQSKLLQCL